MSRRPKKKNFEDPDSIALSEESPATAQQVHRIVTTFKKDVPIDEAEALTVEDEAEEDEELEDESVPDPVQEMLGDLNVSPHSHSWTMIVERLPEYEKNGRSDLNAKRVNCGTRPVTLDFIEDIRREFARPYKPNHFRITFKRDGKIRAHWPGALSLEPPPYDEIAQFEAKAQAAAPPAITINNPGQPQSFKQMLDQFKQLAELRTVLFPELAQLTQQSAQASTPAQTQPLTTESALLHLVSADESLMEKAVNGLSRLFRRTEDGAREVGFLDLAFEAIKQNTLPQLMREFRAMMKEGAQINGQPQTSTPAPPQSAPPENQGNQMGALPHTQTQPQGVPSNDQGISFPPHIQLLNHVIESFAKDEPIETTAEWITSFEKIYPGVTPYIEMFLAMAPDQALAWLAQAAPQTQPITAAPHAQAWVMNLQNALSEDGGPDEPNGSMEGAAGDR